MVLLHGKKLRAPETSDINQVHARHSKRIVVIFIVVHVGKKRIIAPVGKKCGQNVNARAGHAKRTAEVIRTHARPHPKTFVSGPLVGARSPRGCCDERSLPVRSDEPACV